MDRSSSVKAQKNGAGMYAQFVGAFEEPCPECGSDPCQCAKDGGCGCGCKNPNCSCADGNCACEDNVPENKAGGGDGCCGGNTAMGHCRCGGCRSDCRCGACGVNNDCGCVCGAADVIMDYESSKYDKAKEKVINTILDAATALNIKFSGSTIQEKIKSLIAAIPAEARFKNDAKTRDALCISLAKKINTANGSQLIDESNPEFVCQQIMEMLSSLNAGMYNEFLGVYNDVKSVIANMKVLHKIMNDLISEVEHSADKIDADGGDAAQAIQGLVPPPSLVDLQTLSLALAPD